jgi:prolyl-tRNA editing enzyme YbaK/EbsC (Cys-tRNA(Pro) deacylase)
VVNAGFLVSEFGERRQRRDKAGIALTIHPRSARPAKSYRRKFAEQRHRHPASPKMSLVHRKKRQGFALGIAAGTLSQFDP